MEHLGEARVAMAESLAQELEQDLTPDFMKASDRVLAQLWMRGFKVVPLTRDER